MGLYVERSPEMIAGLLGILKAGAAYVPLDPAYPRERLLLMIEDVHMPLVLTQERLAGGMAGLGEVIAIDSLGETGPEDDANPQSGAVGDNLAYAIFTSGSTGRPKPVGVSHRALTHHMAGTRQVLRMGEHSTRPGAAVLDPQFRRLGGPGLHRAGQRRLPGAARGGDVERRGAGRADRRDGPDHHRPADGLLERVGAGAQRGAGARRAACGWSTWAARR